LSSRIFWINAFSCCTLRPHDLALFLQVGQLALDRVEAILGGTVLPLFLSLALDLELPDLALDLVQLLGRLRSPFAGWKAASIDEVDRPCPAGSGR